MADDDRPDFHPRDSRRKYDWDNARIAYVEGMVDDNGERHFPTLQEVSEEFIIPPHRVRERSSKESWKEQRAAFQAHLDKVRQDKRAKELAQDAVDMDSKALASAKAGLQLVQARLGELAQALQRARREAQEHPDEHPPPAFDSRELDSLARAAQGWHQLSSKAIGDVETTRTEIVGSHGGPVEVRQSVTAELRKDDPERLSAFVVALNRAGVLGEIASTVAGESESEGDPHDDDDAAEE